MMDSIKLTLLILLLPIYSTNPYTGSIPIFQTSYNFTYTTTTSSSLVHFQLVLNPSTAAGLLLGRSVPFTVSTNRRDWLHYDYLSWSHCDYSSMVTGQNQYAWITSPGIAQTIHFTIINFQPSRSFSYTVTVAEGATYLKSCPVIANILASSYYCSTCDSFHIGTMCQHRRHSVLEATTSSFNLATSTYTSFTLQSKKAIKITCIYNGAISLFLQTQSNSNEMAGIVNYLDRTIQGKHIFTGSGELTLEYSEEGSNILIGVINNSGVNISFSIFFEVIQEQNVVLIIVIVIGSILLLIILIALVYIIRKILRLRQNIIVIPVESVLVERQREKRQFTLAELDLFFPPVPFGLILQHSRDSEKRDQEQCVICLCPITTTEDVRAGYCKHIFHSGCLMEWFKKQQNCPYCRRDYTREETVKAYRKIVAKDEPQAKGHDIVKAIFGVKSECSLQTLVISDISCENYIISSNSYQGSYCYVSR